MPRGEHFKGKPSMNPAARSVLHRGVHDGRFLEGQDRRHTKRYENQAGINQYGGRMDKWRSSTVVIDGNVPVGSFEDWLIGTLDKDEELSNRLRAIQADRPRKQALAKLFWKYVEENTKNARD